MKKHCKENGRGREEGAGISQGKVWKTKIQQFSTLKLPKENACPEQNLPRFIFQYTSNETHLGRSMLSQRKRKGSLTSPPVLGRGSVKMAVGRSPFSSRNQRLSLHISHKPLRAAPLAQAGPARGAAIAHARADVTRAPRPRASWQEWSRLLPPPAPPPPPRRSRARRAGSRCLGRGGAAGGHGVEQGARGGAAMGLRQLW